MAAARGIAAAYREGWALAVRHPALLPLVLVPGAAGFAASAACPMRRDDGAAIPFRPPAWVFGVAWPLLYLSFGKAWFLAAAAAVDGAKLDAPVLLGAAAVCLPYAVCTAAMTAWIPMRAPVCRGRSLRPQRAAEKKRSEVRAFWLLLLALFAAIFAASLPGQPAAAGLLVLPLVCWLVAATLMSYWEFAGGRDLSDARLS
jgi:tryptophan-rich sensory protein